MRKEDSETAPCLHHPGHSIHHFCLSPRCLLPMCGICHDLHSQEHRAHGTRGEFVQIDGLVDYVRGYLSRTCSRLEEMSVEYTNDYGNKRKMIEGARERLGEVKGRVWREVELMFAEVEIKVERHLEAFQARIWEGYKKLEEEIQYLYDSVQMQLGLLGQPKQQMKQVIIFKDEQTQQKVEDWMGKFEFDKQRLRKEGVMLNVEQKLGIESIAGRICLSNVFDEGNMLMQSSSRSLLKSNRTSTDDPRLRAFQ